MSTSRNSINPVEIEAPAEHGDSRSTYIFDVSDYMLAGDVCTGIVRALSEVMDRSPDRMPPLTSVVDCDALELLFQPRRYGDLRDDVSVSFPYDIYEVTVHASGQVVVHG